MSNKHGRQRSLTTAIPVTSILEDEQVETASDKSNSTSRELLSSATELINEENIINDTQDMERKNGAEDEDEDEFISDDASLPAPRFIDNHFMKSLH